MTFADSTINTAAAAQYWLSPVVTDTTPLAQYKQISLRLRAGLSAGAKLNN